MFPLFPSRPEPLTPASVAAACAVLALVVITPEASECLLSVSTVPTGVQVWLDAQYIGDSPIPPRITEPGRHTLRLVDPVRRISGREEVTLADGDTLHVEHHLRQRHGTLQVTTTPPGTHVLLSTDLGTTPLTNAYMSPGRYRVDLKPPGKRHRELTTEVTVHAGETVSLEEQLEDAARFDRMDGLRLALGAGALASFVWALIEQAEHSRFEEKTASAVATDRESLQSKSDDAAALRTVGIVLGSACVIGFEVVAFF